MIVFERLCLRDEIMASANPEQAWRELTTTSPGVVARVAQAEREFAVYQRRDGVFSRPSVLENAKNMEPAAWWGMYGKHLPLLSAIAPRVLAQAAAASAADRAQLVSLWPDPGRPQITHVSRHRGQARVLPRSDACAVAHARCRVERRRGALGVG